MITVEHLYKTYEDKSGQTNALTDVSFTLPETGLVFILGKSGSGKTTLLNMLGGMDSPTNGDIIINDQSLADKSGKELDEYRRKSVGFVFQDINLINSYTAGSNISLAAQIKGEKVSRDEVEALLKEVDLVDFEGNTLYDRKIKDLSGGQKQRVAIARALIKNPDIILADEPTGALDSETGEDLFALLKKLSEDKLIIVVTHDRECAEKFGDRIIELKDGEIISDKQSHACIADDGAGHEDAQEYTHDDAPKKQAGRLWQLTHLPVQRIVTLGLAGFKNKTVRLVLSVILAVIALTVFVFAASAIYTDTTLAEMRTAYSKGACTVTINPTGTYEGWDYYYGNRKTQHYSGTISSYKFSKGQVDILESATSVYPCIVNPVGSTSAEYVGNYNLTQSVRLNPYIYFSADLISRCVVINSQSNLEDIEFSPATSDSRLPQSTDEIAITDYQADIFTRLGYLDYDAEGEGAELQLIDKWSDMIGKSLLGRTVVGIYSTEESLDWFKQYDKDFDGVYIEGYSDDFFVGQDISRWMRGDHMLKTAVIYSEDGWADNYSAFIYRLTGSASHDRNIIRSLDYDELTSEETKVSTEYSYLHYSAYITTAYTGYVNSGSVAVTVLTSDIFHEVCLIAGIVLAVFSALLLMNFLLVSTESRKRDIGILRSLGASRMDTVCVCAAQSVMVALLDFILAIIFGAVACLVINISSKVIMFSLEPLPILFLFLLCFGSVALATILPAIRTSKNNPVEILRTA